MEDGQRLKARSESAKQNHGAVVTNCGGCSAVAMTKYGKKECLFLTNEATILLKTKDRVYERSQTKPILDMRILMRIGCGRLKQIHPEGAKRTASF